MKRYYHICSKGLEKNVIFLNREDFISGVNDIAVCRLKFDVVILCFCLMSNHFPFVLYGTDVQKIQSERLSFTFQIGGLNLVSNFNANNVIKAGDNINIPITVSAADPDSTINAFVDVDGSPYLKQEVDIGDTTIVISPWENNIGVHTLKVYLQNEKGKLSNSYEYSIIIAEEGIIYIIPSQNEYTVQEGIKLEFLTVYHCIL